LFPTEEAGGIFPAPSTEKSAPYDSKRAGLAPGPWKHLAPKKHLFQRTKVLQFMKEGNSIDIVIRWILYGN
jgi:hypothetical protein